MKARLDAVLSAFEDDRQERRQWQRDLDTRLFGPGGVMVRYATRIASLERWKAYITGGLALLGILWTVLAAWIKGK